jgi:carbon-monoxide dehydrogenase small subunit
MPANRILIEMLQEDLYLYGTRLSCNQAMCGACTVLIDGQPVASCSTFAFEADGARVETVEGLAKADSELHAIQEAFVERKAFQCGFCTSGMLMTVKALLQEHDRPDPDTVKRWLSGNVCRCTGYKMILEAVEAAAVRMADDSSAGQE